MYRVEDEENLVKIKIIGIGGGGDNAVAKMNDEKVKNVELAIFNTEEQILSELDIPVKMQIGKITTRGLGAGANPDIGEMSALESEEEIRRYLEGTDMVFLTAGMGGGTGTGAIPVVARIAKDLGILTVAIVTKPFLFEGKARMTKAKLGIEKLYPNVDALIVIQNDKLIKIADKTTTLEEAFEFANVILKHGVKSVTDLITTVGEINIDFADIKAIMQNKGVAYMGMGKANGEARVVEATQMAISNPLTEAKINGAKGVIFNVKGSQNLGLMEINSGIKLVNDIVDEDANIIFGTSIDDTLGDDVFVTVIATGVADPNKIEEKNNITNYFGL